MKKEKLLFLLLIIFALSAYSSFRIFGANTEIKSKKYLSHQKMRRETLKQKRIRQKRLPQIRYLNQGQPYSYQGSSYASDQVLVKFKPILSIQEIETEIQFFQLKAIDRIPKINVYQLQLPENITVEEMIYVLSQNPDVEYAEPNYIFHIAKTPNDTYFKYQYALYNYGQKIGESETDPQGTPRADIKATEAWEETIGFQEVIIAVIDTGADMLHPDLKNKILSPGYDFINSDYDATDDHGHGTHIAGIAAAETNNQIGVAGVAWNSKILPIKVLDEKGEGDSANVSKAIIWAADQEVDVINMSFGGDISFGNRSFSQTIEDSLGYAFKKDIVLVAAAGNDGGSVKYPASSEYCLAVAASDYSDKIPDWSNFGPEVDVAAPGEQILSLWPVSKTGPGYLPYAFSDGTSMSTPHVAGLAALIKGIKPWLKNWEIMDIIRYSADDINSSEHPGKDEFIGYGRINMEKALVPLIITSSKKR